MAEPWFRNCIDCSKRFQMKMADRKRRKRCQGCVKKMHAEAELKWASVACTRCGKVKKRRLSGQMYFFCSRKCQITYWKDNSILKDKIVVCDYCGKEKPADYRAKKHRRHFCSSACYFALRREEALSPEEKRKRSREACRRDYKKNRLAGTLRKRRLVGTRRRSRTPLPTTWCKVCGRSCKAFATKICGDCRSAAAKAKAIRKEDLRRRGIIRTNAARLPTAEITCPDCGDKRTRYGCAVAQTMRNTGGRCLRCSQRWNADLWRRPRVVRICKGCKREDLLTVAHVEKLKLSERGELGLCGWCYRQTRRHIKSRSEHSVEEMLKG